MDGERCECCIQGENGGDCGRDMLLLLENFRNDAEDPATMAGCGLFEIDRWLPSSPESAGTERML
jgi:hypothetical protein